MDVMEVNVVIVEVHSYEHGLLYFIESPRTKKWIGVNAKHIKTPKGLISGNRIKVGANNIEIEQFEGGYKIEELKYLNGNRFKKYENNVRALDDFAIWAYVQWEAEGKFKP